VVKVTTEALPDLAGRARWARGRRRRSNRS
jgi:hypothetical protein